MSSLYKITAVGLKDAFYKDRFKVIGTVIEVPSAEYICYNLHEEDPNWLGFSGVRVVYNKGKFEECETVSFHQVKVEQLNVTAEQAAILAKFEEEGQTASYHYADDSGREWSQGSAAESQAMEIVKANPELLDDFKLIGKGFLWSFSDACKRIGLE